MVKQAINEINAQINALRTKLEQVRITQRADEIKTIVRSMRDNAISPEEISIAFADSVRTRKKPASTPGARKRPPVPPKYRHPNTGETWTGRGRPPRWLSAEESSGADRDQFLIAKTRS